MKAAAGVINERRDVLHSEWPLHSCEHITDDRGWRVVTTVIDVWLKAGVRLNVSQM